LIGGKPHTSEEHGVGRELKVEGTIAESRRSKKKNREKEENSGNNGPPKKMGKPMTTIEETENF